MYFLGEVDKSHGTQAQEVLRKYLEDRLILLHIGSQDEAERILMLMRKYRRMDFADGSLVAAAETLQTRCVFTLDSDF
jgi:predicted nucleic acid-binding protein